MKSKTNHEEYVMTPFEAIIIANALLAAVVQHECRRTYKGLLR